MNYVTNSGQPMTVRLSSQPACGILDSLIARLLGENELEGLALRPHSLRYTNRATILGC